MDEIVRSLDKIYGVLWGIFAMLCVILITVVFKK